MGEGESAITPFLHPVKPLVLKEYRRKNCNDEHGERGENREAPNGFKNRTGTGCDQENVSNLGIYRNPGKGAALPSTVTREKKPVCLAVERLGTA